PPRQVDGGDGRRWRHQQPQRAAAARLALAAAGRLAAAAGLAGDGSGLAGAGVLPALRPAMQVVVGLLAAAPLLRGAARVDPVAAVVHHATSVGMSWGRPTPRAAATAASSGTVKSCSGSRRMRRLTHTSDLPSISARAT